MFTEIKKGGKMNKHAMANEYKILCSEANKMVKMKDGATTSNGWTKIDGDYDRGSNFKAVLYEKDGQYALCFVGTDRFSAKDWGANAKMAFTGESKQIELAQEFAEKMRDQYGLNSENTQSGILKAEQRQLLSVFNMDLRQQLITLTALAGIMLIKTKIMTTLSQITEIRMIRFQNSGQMSEQLILHLILKTGLCQQLHSALFRLTE